MKYRMLLHYDAYAEKIVEADSEEEAVDIAFDDFDMLDFEGEYDIEDIVEIEDDEE